MAFHEGLLLTGGREGDKSGRLRSSEGRRVAAGHTVRLLSSIPGDSGGSRPHGWSRRLGTGAGAWWGRWAEEGSMSR